MADLIFVYGTLMRGFDHPMSKLLVSGADFVGDAACRGRLYMVAHYPGLLLSTDEDDIVHGELFRMHEPDAMLAVLDDYEGIGPEHEQPALYLREMLAVTLGDGSVSAAWTYIYNRPVVDATRIVSGRFLAP
ncbi:MAG: gamma-glutamylcyclotransferase family protein [Tardiphaga sp.]